MFNFLGKKKEENESEEITEKKQSFFERLKKGLVNTRNNLSSKIDNLLSMSTKIDEELFEELEYILVSADIGANVTMELIDDLKEIVKKEKITELFPKGLYFEDIEFFYKLIPNINSFAFVEEPLVYYVQRENSQSKEPSYKTAQIFNIFDDVFDYYRKSKIYDKYRRELEYSYARILLCSSLKRMCKIKDDVARNRLCYETWTNLNTKFPDWKKNKLLKINNGKNFYMRTVNNKTFKFYCNLFKKL